MITLDMFDVFDAIVDHMLLGALPTSVTGDRYYLHSRDPSGANLS